MKPARVDLIIYRGSTFSKTFQWKTGETPTPVDLTGCSIKMQIRENPGTAILDELSTANSRITITDAVNGKFSLKVSNSESTSYTFSSGKYDIEITFPGTLDVYRVIQGTVTIDQEITV